MFDNPNQSLPLVVDLDGTLTPTDTLVESLVCLLKKNPLNLFRICFWLLFGGSRAMFKHRVATESGFHPRNLPWRTDLIAWLSSERDAGRRIVLATAAHESIAHAVSHHLG